MKKLLFLGLSLLVLLAACSEKQVAEHAKKEVLEMDWSQIEQQAKGSDVHLYMWGGDDGINQYIDEVIAPALKENHDVTLSRHPMNTSDFISKLMTEKKANKEDGTIDIIWINGENFRNAKENDLLLGSFAKKLPNFQMYVDSNQAFVNQDMGTAIDGMEAPWGKVQFVLHYDEAKVQDPPKNFTELIEWSKDNPGQFTYPNVGDFSGNAFVRHLLYAVAEDPNDLIEKGFNQEWLNNNGEKVWEKLNSLKPNLWRNGKTYPESIAQLDRLYANGEVAFTMGFNEARIKSLIEQGTFPKTTKSIVLEPGTIGNAHYLSIPFNSPNPTAAMVAINYFLSPEAQIAKMDASMWGEGMVLDPGKLSEMQLEEMKETAGFSVVKPEQILLELDSQYSDWIREHWENEVVK